MRRCLLPMVLGIYLAGASAGDMPPGEKLTQGGFPDVDKLALFVRGVTEEAVVIRELGAPSGRGASLLPPDYRKRAILYYENVEVTDYEFTSTEPGSSGYIQLDMTQQILGVLILDGRFDGFLWYTNIATPEATFDMTAPVR